jgi:hypothetical protein
MYSMSKRGSEQTFSVDKAKVRVFFAELEGNNESVQEALRTMVSAMSRPVRVISEQKANGGPVLLTQDADVEGIEEAADQAEEFQASEDESALSNTRKARGTGKKVDRNGGINLVPDLNFRPDGKQAFKVFLDEKKPKNDLETTLATVYYMQHILALIKIGPGHVMTAFKEAGTAVPVDLRQTIRNLKNSKVWLKFSDLENLETTTQGENFVEHEMGKSD